MALLFKIGPVCFVEEVTAHTDCTWTYEVRQGKAIQQKSEKMICGTCLLAVTRHSRKRVGCLA
jgi:hypothetical protein